MADRDEKLGTTHGGTQGNTGNTPGTGRKEDERKPSSTGTTGTGAGRPGDAGYKGGTTGTNPGQGSTQDGRKQSDVERDQSGTQPRTTGRTDPDRDDEEGNDAGRTTANRGNESANKGDHGNRSTQGNN